MRSEKKLNSQNSTHLNLIQQVFEEYNSPDNYGLEHIIADILMEKTNVAAAGNSVDWFGLSDLTL